MRNGGFLLQTGKTERKKQNLIYNIHLYLSVHTWQNQNNGDNQNTGYRHKAHHQQIKMLNFYHDNIDVNVRRYFRKPQQIYEQSRGTKSRGGDGSHAECTQKAFRF